MGEKARFIHNNCPMWKLLHPGRSRPAVFSHPNIKQCFLVFSARVTLTVYSRFNPNRPHHNIASKFQLCPRYNECPHWIAALAQHTSPHQQASGSMVGLRSSDPAWTKPYHELSRHWQSVSLRPYLHTRILTFMISYHSTERPEHSPPSGTSNQLTLSLRRPHHLHIEIC